MSAAAHAADAAQVLARAARILAGMGCPAEVFEVKIVPQPSRDGWSAVIRIRKFFGEPVPALETPAPLPAGEAADGWLLWTDLERRIIEHVRSLRGQFIRADDLAVALGENATGDFKSVLRSLAERSGGRLDPVQGKGVHWVEKSGS